MINSEDAAVLIRHRLSQAGAAAVLHVTELKHWEISASSHHNAALKLFTALQAVHKDMLTFCKSYATYVDKHRGNEVYVCVSLKICPDTHVCARQCLT